MSLPRVGVCSREQLPVFMLMLTVTCHLYRLDGNSLADAHHHNAETHEPYCCL